MSTPNRQTRRLPLVFVAFWLLCTAGQPTVLALQPTLGSQLAALSGKNLTVAECRQRMQALDTLLQGAGYRNVWTSTLSDGTLIARWYHPGREMTALAFSGQNSTGNAFSVGEHAGLIRQGELIAIP